MTGEQIYCPKCRKPLSKDNMPIFQSCGSILLTDLESAGTKHPLRDRYTNSVGRYCCDDCSFCFIIEEVF